MNVTMRDVWNLQEKLDNQRVEIDKLQYLVALLRQEKEDIEELKNLESQTGWRLKNVEWERDALKAKLHAAEAELELVQEERDELKADYHQPQLCDEKIEYLGQEIEKAKATLLATGLHPLYHNTIEDAARGASQLIKCLRADLSDPPHDVQCLVLKKLLVKGYCEGTMPPEYKLKKLKKDAGHKP